MRKQQPPKRRPPRKKSPTPRPKSAQQPWHKAIPYKGWAVFVVASSLVGAYLSWLQLRPDVSLSIGNTRDATVPMESHFSINNNSYYSINHVHYECIETSLTLPDGERIPSHRMHELLDMITIAPKKSASIYCGGHLIDYYEAYPGTDVAKLLKSEHLSIFVKFRPAWWPWVIGKDFVFTMIRNKDSTAEWLPADGAWADLDTAEEKVKSE